MRDQHRGIRSDGPTARRHALALVLLAGLCAAPALAEDDTTGRWAERHFDYAVVDQDLRQVLQEFGRNLGLVVRLSDDVHGRVRNMPGARNAREFLDTVAAQQNLVWYDDGAVLHVAAADEVQSKIIPLAGASYAQLKEALAELGLAGQRFGLRASANSNLVNVTGPPDYLALVEQTIEVLGQARSHEVRVLRGRGASDS